VFLTTLTPADLRTCSYHQANWKAIADASVRILKPSALATVRTTSQRPNGHTCAVRTARGSGHCSATRSSLGTARTPTASIAAVLCDSAVPSAPPWSPVPRSWARKAQTGHT
jgi:hypothetical protein